MLAVRRRRRHADRRNFFLRPVEPDHRAVVIVAVQQKLGALIGQHAAQVRGIDKAP